MTRRSSPAARRCFWVSSILSRAASICSPMPPVVASDGRHCLLVLVLVLVLVLCQFPGVTSSSHIQPNVTEAN
jgi:hypothetical protein